MSSTPLFDSIARRREHLAPAPDRARADTAAGDRQRTDTADAGLVAAPVRPVRLDAPRDLVVQSASGSSSPTSPLDGPEREAAAARTPGGTVPADLVEMIDGIPAALRASLAREHVVRSEHLPLIEAVVDAVTRAVVDAVVAEVDRIVASGVVRA
jgi:hypothetical protein